MRRIRTAGLGLAAALSAQAAVGQDAPRPAARLGAVRPAAQLGAVTPAVVPAGMVARGQATPVVQAQANGPGSVSLTMPQTATGPSVTESRGVPAGPPVGGMFGSGQPQIVGMGQPFVVGQQPTPAGQPVPFVPQFPGGQPLAADPTCPPGQVCPPGQPVGVPTLFPSTGAVVGGPVVAPDRPLYGGYLGGPTGLLTGGGNFIFSADYLLWYAKSESQPTLFTTSPPNSRGIIGQPGTTSVLGGPTFQDNLHGGARFGAQYWFGQQRIWGIGGDLFFLGRNGETYSLNSHQYPVLARPFYNLNLNQNDSELVGFPGILNGSASVTTETSIFGGGADFRRRIVGQCGGCSTLDMLAGFRGMKISEGLTISEAIATAPGVTLPNNAVYSTVTDSFQTENQFYGFNMGLAGEIRRGRWFLNGKATVALGDVFEQLEIAGGQTVTTPGGVQAFNGGLYALPTNSGTFTRNKFAVLPEVGFQVGYFLTPHWRVGVGYNFLYLSNMIRPADQIDPGLDVTKIPNFNLPGGPAVNPLPYPRPAPTFRETDFFLQGISFSLQFLW